MARQRFPRSGATTIKGGVETERQLKIMSIYRARMDMAEFEMKHAQNPQDGQFYMEQYQKARAKFEQHQKLMLKAQKEGR